jgi:hypothetical protein
MTPRDIITKAIQNIPGMRFPLAKTTVDKIFRDLEEEGFEIVDSYEMRKAQNNRTT